MLLNASMRWLILAAALAGCCYSALLARAAYLFDKNTAASVAEAVQLVPYNSAYLARLAAWNPDEQAILLKRATALNPFDSNSWVQLGLFAELEQRDLQTAEQYYLKAAEVDHMFQPKWTLTNFYFRRQNQPQFFHWAKETLAITPYASDPVFMQMWSVTQDTAKIEAAIPERPRVLLQYASFLSGTNRLDAIPLIIQRLIRAAGNSDPHAWGRDDLLAGIEDRLLAAGDIDAALRVWASMSKAGWIRANVPTDAHPLTNGDFSFLFYGHGFDWSISSVADVTIDQVPDDKELRIMLSGQQPEQCELLRQHIPLAPGRNYEMRWKADAVQINAPSGLVWHVRCAGENPTLVSADLLDTPESVWRFRAPDARLCVLTLEYARLVGTVRARGTVNLHSVSIAAANRR